MTYVASLRDWLLARCPDEGEDQIGAYEGSQGLQPQRMHGNLLKNSDMKRLHNILMLQEQARLYPQVPAECLTHSRHKGQEPGFFSSCVVTWDSICEFLKFYLVVEVWWCKPAIQLLRGLRREDHLQPGVQSQLGQHNIY
uniref:uncharacterized protein LOC118152928 isoform X2 n=1 Tax=Callithrix jacchus TaxID=9483 RepID=UPI0023DD15D6|nr:uncharacterized protein LOC118152928 isoform X2 [Callithrix jacchus]